MKNSKLVLLVVILSGLLTLLAGCGTTPKVVSVSPAAIGYQYGQEPQKRAVAAEGRQYKEHVKELQAAAYRHEENLAAIECGAKEREVAKEKGFTVPTNPPPPVVDNQRQYGPGAQQAVPWNQIPGAMPVYQPAPVMPSAVYAQPSYGGVGTVRVSTGKFLGIFPIRTTSWSTVYTAPVYTPPPVEVYYYPSYSVGVGWSGGFVPRNWGPRPRCR